MLLDAWLEFEQEQGTAASQARVKKLMPTQVKRRREVFGEDGVSGAWASGRLRRIDCCPVLPWPAATPFFFFFAADLPLCQHARQTSEGWEEYWDFVFPDEQTAKPHLKLLQMAQKWKQQQAQQEQGQDGGADAVDETEDA